MKGREREERWIWYVCVRILLLVHVVMDGCVCVYSILWWLCRCGWVSVDPRQFLPFPAWLVYRICGEG